MTDSPHSGIAASLCALAYRRKLVTNNVPEILRSVDSRPKRPARGGFAEIHWDSKRRPTPWRVSDRGLAQQPIGLGQQARQDELPRAPLPRGLQISARPVAGRFRHRGVKLASLAAVAVVLVIRQEA